MNKYVTVGSPQKTVGAYLKVVKALNELRALDDGVVFHPTDDALYGITGRILEDPETGEWRFVQE